MRIALITFGYNMREKFPKHLLSAIEAARVKDPILSRSEEPLVHREIEGDDEHVVIDYWHWEIPVDIDKMPQIPFEVKALSSLVVKDFSEQINTEQRAPFNHKVNVSVPGNGLLEIDEVTYRTDYCSDMLANDLIEGWRIVAVCPQPDQRRPDYILGRKARVSI